MNKKYVHILLYGIIFGFLSCIGVSKNQRIHPEKRCTNPKLAHTNIVINLNSDQPVDNGNSNEFRWTGRGFDELQWKIHFENEIGKYYCFEDFSVFIGESKIENRNTNHPTLIVTFIPAAKEFPWLGISSLFLSIATFTIIPGIISWDQGYEAILYASDGKEIKKYKYHNNITMYMQLFLLPWAGKKEYALTDDLWGILFNEIKKDGLIPNAN
ncbi:hypothetical protein [Leptospira alexanderi]|uniref:hypothetical protein n=1 Tax=Leptospira alexanderi TaxID=100053 RepID=UPI0009914A41|nr:hypothetical protein [Leptospira alexanderi]